MIAKLYLTVLLYLVPGQEEVFAQYEDLALSLLGEHGGELLYRLRPRATEVVSSGADQPYEIHLLTFPDEYAFEQFLQNPARLAYAGLRAQAIRQTVIIKGHQVI